MLEARDAGARVGAREAARRIPRARCAWQALTPLVFALACDAAPSGAGDAPDGGVIAAPRRLSLIVSSVAGSDECLVCAQAGCECGTPARPLASLMAAQALADAFVEREVVSAQQDQRALSALEVEIRVSGVFHGQWLRWRHPRREVGLTLRSEPGQRAVFDGAGHPCQSTLCFTDDRAPPDGTSAPSFAPVPCDSSEDTRTQCASAGVASYVGYTLVGAHGGTGWFQDHYRDYSGFGAIRIEGIDVREYHTAIRVSGWSAADVRARGEPGARLDALDAPVEGMRVTSCRFERVGEIANNTGTDDPDHLPMSDAYTAIALSYVNNSTFSANEFVDIVNYGSWIHSKILMHAIYTKNSDQNVYVGNVFRNVSGQPIKFRNSSDRNLVVGNSFEAGPDSVTRLPVQDWYCDWQDVGGNSECAQMELPSFENVLFGNRYLRGYVENAREEHPDVIAIACPSRQDAGGSYDVMRRCAGTAVRMVVEGTGFECLVADSPGVEGESPLNTHLVRGRPSHGFPLAREGCSPARCQALSAAAMTPEQAECPLWR